MPVQKAEQLSKDVVISPEPMRLKISLKKISIIIEHIKNKPFIILLNILVIILLFCFSSYLGFAGLIIEIILLFLMPPQKEKTKEITHL